MTDDDPTQLIISSAMLVTALVALATHAGPIALLLGAAVAISTHYTIRDTDQLRNHIPNDHALDPRDAYLDGELTEDELEDQLEEHVELETR